MSVISSTKPNFSISEMSVGSSALMTAASTYTFSDADYETSSELLSPRTKDNNEIQISRYPSSVRFSKEYNYIFASQSNSVLLDKTKKSVISFEANKCVLKIKSDTCLSQQGKAISEFMNDILRVQEEQKSRKSCEILSIENSIDSLQTELFLNFHTSNSTSNSKVDNNSLNSLNSIDVDVKCINLDNFVNNNKVESKPFVKQNTKTEEKKTLSTLSQTKHQILENLAQVNCNKFFAKPELRHIDSINNHPLINNSKPTFFESCQKKPITKVNTPSQTSQVSGKFLRKNGVESILRIDYELQPLNLMLSRLLAEFRAMNLRGRLDYTDTNIYDWCSFNDLDKELHIPEVKSFKTVSQCSASGDVVTHEATMINKATQKDSTPNEKHTRNKIFFHHAKDTEAVSVTHDEDLPVNQILSKTKNSAQISRSYEGNRRVSRDQANGVSQLRVKTLYKRDTYRRCCNRHKKNIPRCCSTKKQQSHHENRCIVTDHSSQKEKTEVNENFVRSILEEITAISTRCIEEEEEEENRRRNDAKKDCKKDVDEQGEETSKEIENESLKLHLLRCEETKKSNSISCSGSIPSAVNSTFLIRPPSLSDTTNIPGDSLSKDNDNDIPPSMSSKICDNDEDHKNNEECPPINYVECNDINDKPDGADDVCLDN